MRSRLFSGLVLFTLAGSLAAADRKLIDTMWDAELTDPDTLAVLQRIESAGAYAMPDLNLKKDQNYAQTPQDLEPFRGVKPYKEHFLLQIEYTGAGRGIVEPPDLKSVK